MIPRRSILLLSFAASLPAIAAAQGAPSPRPLAPELTDLAQTLDMGCVAARGLPPNVWGSVGLPAPEKDAWPIADWTLYELDPQVDLTPLGGLEGLVERLAQSAPATFVSPVFVGEDGGPLFATPTLLVRFEPEGRGPAARALLAEYPSLTIEAEDWAGMKGAYKLSSSERDGFELLRLGEELESQEIVLYAEPDWIFTGRGAHVPNDPDFNQQWGLHNTGQSGGTPDVDMNGPEAWDITTGDASVQIVIIDTGVQQDHPDLEQNGGADVTSEGPGDGGPVNSWDRHGTAVAGCSSGVIDNSVGIAGSAPDSPCVSVRTFISIDPAGNWTSQLSWTVDALDHAASIGARVTNNSNFYGGSGSSIDDKYAETREAGMIHFAAAGNNSSSSVTYPASLPTVMAIASITRTGALSTFSNFGSDLALSAPGTTIRTTDRTGSAGYTSGDHTTVEGTSYASPSCAGVAALVLSHHPYLNAEQVEDVLQQSAKDLGAPGFDTTYGWGLVDAHAALIAADPCELMGIFCDGARNSAGPGGAIGWSGTSSVSANDLVVEASGCPPGVPGLFFVGPNQVEVPLADGLRCVGGHIARLGVKVVNGAGTVSSPQDLQAPPFDAGVSQAIPGTTQHFQFWYRDMAAGGLGSNLTDALSVTFCN